MTRVQKVFCVFLCLCFLVVLAVMPEPFSLWKIIENVYRQFPIYYFIEEKTQETWLETDKQSPGADCQGEWKIPGAADAEQE